MIHWAKDIADATRTLCGKSVGYLLVEVGDDITQDEEVVECKDCRSELAEGKPEEEI